MRSFIRRQIVFNLFYKRDGIARGFSEDFFDARMSTLFTNWEMEQISEADIFIYQLAEALRRCEKLNDGGLLTREKEQAITRQYQMDLRTGERRGGGAVEVVPVPREEYLTTIAQSLLVLHDKIREVARLDPSLTARILSFPSVLSPTDEEAGGPGFLRASHSYRLGRSPRQPQGTPPLPTTSAPPPASRLECPRAWREAMGPWKELGWGRDLLPGTKPGNMEKEEWKDLQYKFKIWRWAGFVFLDKDRVEALKSAGLLDVREGWLGRYGEEVRNQLVRSLPVWPADEQNVAGTQLLNW
jgi:hypothetical protein